MKRLLPIIILLFLFSFSLKSKELIVRKIEFEGNRTLSSSTLLKQMDLNEKKPILNLVNKKNYSFTENKLKNDLENIKKFYQKQGFLNIEVNHEVIIRENRVYLKVLIKENKPIEIGEIKVNILSPNKSELKIMFSDIDFDLKKSYRFVDKLFLEDIDKYGKKLRHNGYIKHSIDYELDLNRKKNKVDILYIIDSGQEYKFGRTTIFNNNFTKSDFYQKHKTYQAGQTFNVEKLRKTEKKLQNLGIVQYITVKPNAAKTKNLRVPVEIFVKEHPLRKGKIGLGYGLVNKLNLSLTGTKYYFLSGRNQINFNTEHSKYRPYDSSIEFIYLAFPGYSYDLINRYYALYEKEDEFRIRHYGASMGIKYNFSKFFHTQLDYIFERNYISLKKNDPNFKVGQFYNKSSIKTTFILDRTYPVIFPVAGYSLTISNNLSGLALGSRYHFFKSLLVTKIYKKFLGFTSANRIKLGNIVKYNDEDKTPIEARFFGGGATSVRGWARNKISPIDIEGNRVGGNSIFEFSTELRFPIYKIVSGVIFYDWGNVWLPESHYNFSELKESAGFGLRIKTPVGFVRIDSARKTISGNKPWQFYLNLGEVF